MRGAAAGCGTLQKAWGAATDRFCMLRSSLWCCVAYATGHAAGTAHCTPSPLLELTSWLPHTHCLVQVAFSQAQERRKLLEAERQAQLASKLQKKEAAQVCEGVGVG